jgi:hypothetical protein
MIISYGNNDCDSSEAIARRAVSTFVPAVERSGADVLLAMDMRSPSFARDPAFRDVTRDPDDAIVHVHDHHVLLLRTADDVPDDTLVCDVAAGVRALAHAALASDVARKIELASVTDPRVAEFNDDLARAFSFLAAGAAENERGLMVTGHGLLRRNMGKTRMLRANVKYDVFRVLAAAQRAIPEAARTVVSWKERTLDAVVIAAGAGHARSVLHVDPASATGKELRDAMGTATPPVSRGLHYAAYPAKKE